MDLTKTIGIDLGTANTRLCLRDGEIVVREPSVVTFDPSVGRVVAVGTGAGSMLGKTPPSLETMHPLREGVIADFEFTAAMLEEFLKKTAGGLSVTRPSVFIGAPRGITEVQRRAIEDAAIEAGAGNVTLVDELLAAALGAGLPVRAARGSMIVDIGAGTTEAGVVAHGGLVTTESVKSAGGAFDSAIAAYVKQEFNVLIGEATAREIKVKIGSAHSTTDIGAIEVKGRNLRTGKAAEFTMYSSEVREAIREPMAAVFELVRTTLEGTPPELCADIYETGFTICGGGALLGGLSFYLEEMTHLPVKVAANSQDCVITGIGRILSDASLREAFEKKHSLRL